MGIVDASSFLPVADFLQDEEAPAAGSRHHPIHVTTRKDAITVPNHHDVSRRVFLEGSALGFTSLVSPPIAARLATEPRNRHPRLIYRQPASEAAILQEGLPIGNGRIGALWGGPPGASCLYVTAGGGWSGGSNDHLGDDGQFPYDREGFGSLEMLARARLEIEGQDETDLENYRHELDLADGCIRSAYDVRGHSYRQTIFASHVDNVLVILVEASDAAPVSGRVRLEGAHGEAIHYAGRDLSFFATHPNGVVLRAAVRAVGEGGSVTQTEQSLRFRDCRSLLLLFHGQATSKDFPLAALHAEGSSASALDAAAGYGARQLVERHIADHRSLFDRCSIDLGVSSVEQRAMDVGTRLAARARIEGKPDPELDALYLQYGRYLTIACSRGGLPSALQGLWMVNNRPPWMGDYHTDINIEMNYWLPDRSALPECFEPLASYCLSQYPIWERRTQLLFNDPRNRFRNRSGKVAGWTVAMSLNIAGGMGWRWHPAGNAWICNTLYQHYQYGRDTAYLRKIFPLLKGACFFWESRLVEISVPTLSGGIQTVLVDDWDWSPENGPDPARGISYAQELVRELFSHFCSAAEVLGQDLDIADRMRALRARLYRPAVSKAGVLEEWMSSQELGEPEHRHLSPLIGLFPGDGVRVADGDPKLIAAARQLLINRGDRSTGWGNAWRAACWARLKDGERAYALLGHSLAPPDQFSGTAPNLFNSDFDPDDDHVPPRLIFQINGNLGMPAAMLEMLLQSREDVIEVLPALPRAWAIAGSARGLSAFGGLDLDIRWTDGRATTVTARARVDGATTIVANGVRYPIRYVAGQTLSLL